MMANQSDSLLVDLKIKPPIGDGNEPGITSFIHSFIHSVTKRHAVVMNGLLIIDPESFKAADSFTNETLLYVAWRRTPDDTDFIGTIIILLQNRTNMTICCLTCRLHLKCKIFT